MFGAFAGCVLGVLADVYECLLKKTGGGDDLILPKQVEDVELVAERHKYARPRAKRQTSRPQIRQSAPAYVNLPSMKQTPPPEKDVDKADATHYHPPPDRSHRQDNNDRKNKLFEKINFTIYGCGVPPPSTVVLGL
jgi:hypothetical protein